MIDLNDFINDIEPKKSLSWYKEFFYRLREKFNGGDCGYFYVCPAYRLKENKNYDSEPFDEYCILNNLVCRKCKYRFLPDFIIIRLCKRSDRVF
jgi:hypothetical protein